MTSHTAQVRHSKFTTTIQY